MLDPTVDEHVDQHGLVRLDEDTCWEILRRNSLGRIGVVHRRRPLIFPVNYAVDGRTIVFRSGLGVKQTSAALGRPAVFEVDEADERFRRGLSIMVHGWLHEVTDADELNRLRHLSVRPWAPNDREHVLRVHSGRVTGRAIGVTD